MKKKIILSLSTLLVAVVAVLCFWQFGFSNTVNENIQISDLEQSEVLQQQEEIESLKAEIESLKEIIEQTSFEDTSESAELEELEETTLEEVVIEESIAVVEEVTALAETVIQQATTTTVETPVEATTPVVAETPVTTSTVSAKQNSGTVFEGYSVSITNNSILATTSGSFEWPIQTYYFLSADGSKLGSISGADYQSIMSKYRVMAEGGGIWRTPDDPSDWTEWFAVKFNELRGLSSSSTSYTANTTASNFDVEDNASELRNLINASRRAEGTHLYSFDSQIALLAEIRAVELSQSYSHTRPDGSTVMNSGYAEIIHYSSGNSTAETAFNAYYNSSSHKNIMLSNRYNYYGAGCYKASNGRTYWVVLFKE